MTQPIQVLDHGFVKLRNISGPVRRADRFYDASSIDPAVTARISFDEMGSVRTHEDEMKLVRYLIKNAHNTPIEMIEIWLEMKLPIFVARQFVRHRTVTINEVSGRYVELPEEFYIPAILGAKPTDGAKQGQSLTSYTSMQTWKGIMRSECHKQFDLYKRMLHDGVAPEHARMVLPLNTYTHWVWKQDLHNMLHFLKLRMDSHSQVEAQAYANAIHELLSRALPELMDIYDNL